MTKLTREFSFSTGGTSGLLMPYPFMLILKTKGSAFYRPPMGINKLQSARLDFWIQPHRIWAFIMRNKRFGSVGCAAWLCRIANAHIQSGRISKSDRAGVGLANPTEQATENAVQKGVPMGESQRAQICAGWIPRPDTGFSPHGAAGVAALQCCSSKTHKVPVCDSFEQKVGKWK